MKKRIISLALTSAMLLGTAPLPSALAETVQTENAAAVELWFDHATVKTVQKNTESTGMTSYRMYMAKNEIETCQFFIAPSKNVSAEVTVSDFVSDSGDTLETELYFEHYFNMLNGEKMPDALPPVTSEVSVKAGNSQGFIVKTRTEADTAAGDYTATVTVSCDGEVAATGEIALTVWDFALSEETPFQTAVNIDKYNISVQHGLTETEEANAMYKAYYDFMLENRVSAYQLPYDVLSDEADAYMSDPRVTSFAVGGEPVGLDPTDDEIRLIYEKMSSNSDWLDKAYFYYVDEPTEMGKLGALKTAGERLASLYPNYRMVSPFFYNIDIGDKDQFAYMSDYLGIWCTKINAWTPVDTEVEGAIHMMSKEQVELYGDYASRVAAEVEGGDRNWVYYCWEPLGPYTTFDASRQTLEQRVALWQAMDNDVTGFLYFAATLWSSGTWRTIHTINAGGDTVYGDGILLYPGKYPGKEEIAGPISSMRFESLRDGIEDYMYLDMAKELIPEATYNSLMDAVTVSAVEWTDDSELFYHVRVALGKMLEAAVNGDALPKGLVFDKDSGYTANTYTGYVGGVEPKTSAMELLSALECMNGAEILRDGEPVALSDTVLPSDKLVLRDGDGNTVSEFTVIIIGSVNGDGRINLADVTAILRYIISAENEIDTVAADVDGNGTADLRDAVMLLRYIGGWDLRLTSVPVLSGVGNDSLSKKIKTCGSGTQVALNMRHGQELGVKFSVEEGLYAKSVSALCPSWGDSKGDVRFSLYKWNKDYETTVAAMPIVTEKYSGFADNSELVLRLTDSAGKGVGEGEYLWLIHEGYDVRINEIDKNEPVGVGVWTYDAPSADSGMTVFFEGEEISPDSDGAFGPEGYIRLGK